MAKDDDRGKRTWRSPRKMTDEERRRQERVHDIVREHGPISTDDVADHLEKGGAGKPNVRQGAWSMLRRLAGFDQVKDINQESGYEGRSSWWVVHQPEKRPANIPDPPRHEPTGGTGRREPPGSRARRRPAGQGFVRPAEERGERMADPTRKENYYDRVQRERNEREAAQRGKQSRGRGGQGFSRPAQAPDADADAGGQQGGSGFSRPASRPADPPADDQGGGSGFSKPAGRPKDPPPDDDEGGGQGLFRKV